MFTSSDAAILTTSLGKIVYQAGKKILSVYAHDFSSELKQDNTPITMADRESHEIISGGLASLSAPGFGVLPVLSEEGNHIPFEKRSAWSSYWLVDPLDGTKEFIKRNGEFTVNIALVSSGAAVCGAVYIPVTDILYTGFAGYGAFRIDALGSRQDNPSAQGRRLPL